MDIIPDPDALRVAARAWRRAGRSIGFVPTMGNLHDGHLSLIRQSAAECDLTVLSIFVNPLQFGPTEDYGAYPRTFQEDCDQAAAAGADTVFAPTDATMYPPGFASTVEVKGLTETLCGRSRPGHFRGVTTVVMKLFCLLVPDRAYFGEKDYQQLQVIARMTADLGLGTQVVPMPIVREPDGLAMSSRNRYLSLDERRAALCLSRALQVAQAAAEAGASSAAAVVGAARAVIAAEPLATIEYVELVHPVTLAALERFDEPGRLCLAVRLGPARLIDNALLTPRVSKAGGGGSPA